MKKSTKTLLANTFILYPIGLIGLGIVTNWLAPIFILVILTAYNIERKNNFLRELERPVFINKEKVLGEAMSKAFNEHNKK